MVQFLSIIFFSWISSIFVGFFKSSRFFVSPCISVKQITLLADFFLVSQSPHIETLVAFKETEKMVSGNTELIDLAQK